MKREWKPGDVALVRNEYNVWNLAVCSVKASRGVIWQYGVADSWMPMTADARPLVVLDLEDHDALDPIIDLIWGGRDPSNRPATWQVREKLKALLFAPPKPEEPTGLGAVVEDAEGQRWMRGSLGRLKVWVNDDALDSEWRSYRDIAAVRVLSEGVTP